MCAVLGLGFGLVLGFFGFVLCLFVYAIPVLVFKAVPYFDSRGQALASSHSQDSFFQL